MRTIFSPTKFLLSVTKFQRCIRESLEGDNFAPEKILCSLTATLRQVILFRERDHLQFLSGALSVNKGDKDENC